TQPMSVSKYGAQGDIQSKVKTRQLPQAGGSTSMLSWMGIGLVSLATALRFRLRKMKKKQ
ncbi:LPXTG-domain-containing protein cell wall anchor domain, partial [Bacillus cereus VD196]